MGVKTAAVLRRAREKLVNYGWIQGEYGSKSRGFCSYGAVRASTRTEAMRTHAADWLRNVVGLYWVATWNDEPNRKMSEVLNVFTKAAKLAEKDPTTP